MALKRTGCDVRQMECQAMVAYRRLYLMPMLRSGISSPDEFLVNKWFYVTQNGSHWITDSEFLRLVL